MAEDTIYGLKVPDSLRQSDGKEATLYGLKIPAGLQDVEQKQAPKATQKTEGGLSSLRSGAGMAAANVVRGLQDAGVLRTVNTQRTEEAARNAGLSDGQRALPSGVQPSAVEGGRGVVNPLPASVSRQTDQFADKREAIDAAVDAIESGEDPTGVYRQAQRAGITRMEIEDRGAALGGRFFSGAPQDAGTVRPAAASDEMRAFDPTFAHGVGNTFKRAGASLGTQSDILASEVAKGARGVAGAAGVDMGQQVFMPNERLAQRMAVRNKAADAARPSESISEGMQALEKAGEKGFVEWAKALSKNPKAALVMGADSILQSLAPSMVGGALGSLGGPAGAAAGAGASSFAMEYASAISEAVAKAGGNPNNPDDILAALNNPKLMSDARTRGVKRGLTVGIFDGLSAGVAGKFVAPVMDAIQAGTLAGRPAVGAIGRASLKEAGAQGGMGAFGEMAAQDVAGDKRNWNQIGMEFLAEIPGGAIEAAGNIAGQARRAPVDMMADAINATATEYGASVKAAAKIRDAAATMPPDAAKEFVKQAFSGMEREGLVKKPGAAERFAQEFASMTAGNVLSGTEPAPAPASRPAASASPAPSQTKAAQPAPGTDTWEAVKIDGKPYAVAARGKTFVRLVDEAGAVRTVTRGSDTWAKIEPTKMAMTPVGEAVEQPVIPTGEASEQVPAGEASEQIPAGEAMDVEEIPTASATEIDAETVSDSQFGPMDEARGESQAITPVPATYTAPTAPKKPRKAVHSIRGSLALGSISRYLGGISPDLLGDLSQKRERTRVNKLGKKSVFTSWDNPPHAGHGPLFRRGGTSDITEIARVLEEEGFIPEGTLERDYLEARNLAQDIVKRELSEGGSSLQIGNPEAVEQEMRRRIEFDAPPREEQDADTGRWGNESAATMQPPESDPWEDFDFAPDDLEYSGYLDASPNVKELTELLVSDAEALGVSVEDIRMNVAGMVGDLATGDEYETAVQQKLTEAIRSAQSRDAESNAARAQGSAADRGQTSEPESRARGDRTNGPDQAVQAETLTLQAETEAEAQAKAKRKADADKAEKAKKDAEHTRLKKEDEKRETKVRADQTVDDFQLGQDAGGQLSGMRDMFDNQPAESPAPAPKEKPAPSRKELARQAGDLRKQIAVMKKLQECLRG